MSTSDRKVALVTGITGQDGSYLTELLLGKGYEVHGLVRRSSSFNTERIDHLYRDPHDPAARLYLHYGDLSDGSALGRLLRELRPSEIYNLGAQSHVRVTFEADSSALVEQASTALARRLGPALVLAGPPVGAPAAEAAEPIYLIFCSPRLRPSSTWMTATRRLPCWGPVTWRMTCTHFSISGRRIRTSALWR